MIIIKCYIYFPYEKNDFTEVYKNLAEFMLENNFVGSYYSIRNCGISVVLCMQYFSRIGINLAVLYNYLNDLTKLSSELNLLCLIKFLDISIFSV